MRELDPTPIYYVYIHYRKDDGLPFYVGKGKNRRAGRKEQKRGKHWHSVVEKHGYDIEFAWKNIPEKEAFEWEIHLIEQFHLAGFPLVNHTDGGEGCSNKTQTDKKKQELRDFYEIHGRTPRRYKPEEKKLHTLLQNYCSPSRPCFDQSFRAEMVALGYAENHAEENKQEIRDFIKENNRFPSQRKPEEKQLCGFLRSYCGHSSKCFDPVFCVEMVSLGYGQNGDPEGNKQKLREFIIKTGRIPSQRKPEEKQMSHLLRHYCSPTSDCFDLDFRTEMVALGYGADRTEEKKQRLRDFIKENERFPSRYKPEEKRLNKCLGNYCSPASVTFDPSFRTEMEALGYGQRLKKNQTLK